MDLEQNDINIEQPVGTGAIDLREPVTWEAPEIIRDQRGIVWYIVAGVATLVMIVLSVLVFNNWTFAVLLPIMAAAVLTLSIKPPENINYAISPKGVYVADKLYDFSEFRAFGIIKEKELHSAVLLPVKRFSPGLTIYFPEEKGEKIVDMLGARLPIQEIKLDALEKLIRLIKL